jgi:alkylation response protein AidB-like acyl-CoA dehydrogenase
MDYRLPAELEALRAEAIEVAEAASAGRDIREDSWLIGNDADFTRELGERGWLGMTWPTEHGGGGRSALERFVVFETLIAHGAPVASGWFADRQIGPTLLQFGTDEQRREHLPPIIAGTSAWSIGMSEPDAGSDVASVRTRAVRDGDSWIVNG